MSKHRENITAFVNRGNINIHYKGRLLFAERFIPPLLVILVAIFDEYFYGRHPWIMRTICFGILAVFCFVEYQINRQYKITNNNKWILLQTAVLNLIAAISVLLESESWMYETSFSTVLWHIKIGIFIFFFAFVNGLRFLLLSGESYMKQNKREERRWNYDGFRDAGIAVAATIVMRSLNETFSMGSGDVAYAYVFFAASIYYVCKTEGFLKFYYANKYDIDVIPTWIEKTEERTRYKFNYDTNLGDTFHVLLKEKRDAKMIHARVAELYRNENNGLTKFLDVEIVSTSKEDFHIDTILNENGLVCYALNGAPFGKLSDGRFVAFRRVQLEGEPNPEIVYIGEALVQQDIRWFDDFGEYLVKSNSQIGIEIAKRYQDKNFTEAEIQQIEEHSLDIAKIAEWAREILL